MAELRSLVTLTLKGGTSFALQIPGNPEVTHEGGTSVQHLFLSSTEKSEIGRFCKEAGVSLEFIPAPSNQVSPERENLFRRPDEIKVLCQTCPSCPWYDPITLGADKTCFLREAPEESAQVLLENSEAHKKAAQNCPIGGNEYVV